MSGNYWLDIGLFGAVMTFANYFVFYKNNEGRLPMSLIGGVVAMVLFAVMLRILA